MNGKLFKANAKITLKRNFMTIMIVCLIAMFLGAADVNPPSGSFNFNPPRQERQFDIENPEEFFDIEDFDEFEDFEEFVKPQEIEQFKEIMHNPITEGASIVVTVIVMISIFFIVFILSWLFYAFITAPVIVGYKRFFMNNRAGAGKVSDLFSAFSSNYLNVVKVMFGTGIRIFAWSLLLIIPGIVKSYEYFFVPFILAENPTIDGTKARKISSDMTNGHKMDIFILSLSFIGWYFLTWIVGMILAVCTCCCCCIGYYIAFLPLAGYVSCTFAELYQERREFALANGIVNNEDLPGFDDFIKKNLEPINPTIDNPLNLQKEGTLDLNKKDEDNL